MKLRLGDLFRSSQVWDGDPGVSNFGTQFLYYCVILPVTKAKENATSGLGRGKEVFLMK